MSDEKKQRRHYAPAERIQNKMREIQAIRQRQVEKACTQLELADAVLREASRMLANLDLLGPAGKAGKLAEEARELASGQKARTEEVKEDQ